MQRASTLENSSFNVVLLKYLWHTTAVLGHSKSICLTVKRHMKWSQTGWLSLDRRYEWVTRLWPILRRVKTVSSRRHNDVRGLFLPTAGKKPVIITFVTAYCKHHSTETALLCIYDHLINAIGPQKVSCLCLLDLSAAFDTIDHNMLITRLSSWFGIHGSVFSWFMS